MITEPSWENIKFIFCPAYHLIKLKAKGNGTEKHIKGVNVHINIGEL